MTTASTSAFAKDSASDLKAILRKPLIVGASVSGDYLTASPGKTLALRFTNAKDIKVIAANGKPGREVLKSVTESTLKDRTAIIGMDLFFWDSFSPSPSESVHALEKLVTAASAHKIPFVLGEIPEFSLTMQKSAEALNKKIRAVCESHSNCRLLPLNHILLETMTKGYVVRNGTRYSLETLLPDGLHLSKPASDYLADEIQKLL